MKEGHRQWKEGREEGAGVSSGGGGRERKGYKGTVTFYIEPDGVIKSYTW